MKRMMFGLMAILMGVMLAACGGKDGGKDGEGDAKESKGDVKSLFNDVKENGEKWSSEEWETFMKDYYDAVEALLEQDITEDEWNDIREMQYDVFDQLSIDAEKTYKRAFDRLYKENKDFGEQNERIDKKLRELRKKWAYEEKSEK